MLNARSVFRALARGREKILTEALLPSDWDLGGAWITDNGSVEPCDHASDRHHSDIALEHFGEYIETNDEGEHDEYSKDSAQDAAFDNGWIRINTRGQRSLSVEWRVSPSPVTKAALLRYLSSDTTPYETYEVEAMSDFKQFDNLRSMIFFIKKK